jgi:hypothetical protein
LDKFSQRDGAWERRRLESAGLSIAASGKSTVNGTCIAYTVTRSKPATETLIVQPSIKSGQCGIYKEASCTALAFLSIEMTTGTSTANIYYSNVNVSGDVTITVDTLIKSSGAKDGSGSISFTVGNAR